MSFPNPEAWPPAQVAGTVPAKPYELGSDFPQTAYDQPAGPTVQTVTIRWNDDASERWSKEHTLTAGPSSDTEFLAQRFRLGMYVSRQWEIVVATKHPVCIVSAEEEAELLL
jgi:hypothetical protein